MSTQKLFNVSLAEFRRFLQNAGCHQHRVKGRHEHWVKPGLTRPITFQTHIDPVPEFIIRNALRTSGVSREDFCGCLPEGTPTPLPANFDRATRKNTPANRIAFAGVLNPSFWEFTAPLSGPTPLFSARRSGP